MILIILLSTHVASWILQDFTEIDNPLVNVSTTWESRLLLFEPDVTQ
jgi:hypothetical protein